MRVTGVKAITETGYKPTADTSSCQYPKEGNFLQGLQPSKGCKPFG